ncbi:replicative DNA helicase [Ralstonia sp. ASV6]|uniref:replicative DNA helicase n=1 Tax=Ralstonia sp. ASV6 TaxID=2795124 RepID=UPI0018ECB7E5|nr:replicative DNA helicase [Ralstonia sp. ASV6]
MSVERSEGQQLAAIEAEESIVSALFSDHADSAYTTLSQELEGKHFSEPVYRMVYEAYGQLLAKGQSPDSVTLASYLKSLPVFGARAKELLSHAISIKASQDNLPNYAAAVIEKWRARQIAEALKNAESRIARIGGELTSDDVLRDLESIAPSLSTRQKTAGLLKTPLQVVEDVVSRMQKVEAGGLPGARTGIEELDLKLGSMEPGHLIVVAGRPSMGKSVFGLRIAIHNSIEAVPELSPDALQRNPEPSPDASPFGAYFSLEMPDVSLGMRAISALSSVEYGRIRTAQFETDDWARLTIAMMRYSASNIRISYETHFTPSMMRARCRELTRATGKKLAYIVVDYLQLMNSDKASSSQNRATEVSEITRALKQMAGEFECPVVALSQLNRSLESRTDKRPTMGDLRESGAIEQDADTILFLYRDEVYNPDSDQRGTVEIIVAKGRDTGIGVARAQSQLQYQRFVSMPRGEFSYEKLYA